MGIPKTESGGKAAPSAEGDRRLAKVRQILDRVAARSRLGGRRRNKQGRR